MLRSRGVHLAKLSFVRKLSYYIVIYRDISHCTTICDVPDDNYARWIHFGDKTTWNTRGRVWPDRHRPTSAISAYSRDDIRGVRYHDEGTVLYTALTILSHTRAHFSALVNCKNTDRYEPKSMAIVAGSLLTKSTFRESQYQISQLSKYRELRDPTNHVAVTEYRFYMYFLHFIGDKRAWSTYNQN